MRLFYSKTGEGIWPQAAAPAPANVPRRGAQQHIAIGVFAPAFHATLNDIGNARGERRDQGRARASVHSAAVVAGRDAPLIAKAPQRAGVAPRKIAMSAAV